MHEQVINGWLCAPPPATPGAIGTAETPADPISGFILPPEILYISSEKHASDRRKRQSNKRRELL